MDTLRSLDRGVFALFARYDSLKEHQNQLFIPNPASLVSIEADIKASMADVEARSSEMVLPYEKVLVSHFKELLELLQARLIDDREFPYRYARSIIGRINSLVALDTRSHEQRIQSITEILDQTPAVLRAVGELTLRLGAEKRTLTINMVKSIVDLAETSPARVAAAFAGDNASGILRIDSLLKQTGRVAAEVIGLIKGAPVLDKPYKGLTYMETLRLIYGIDLDEFIAWHRDEVEKCYERLQQLGRDIDPDRDPLTILEQDAGPYPNPDDMITAGIRLVAHARQKSLDYITLPQGEVCEVWDTPEHLRSTYPWGGYWGGNILNGDLRGAVFLNRCNYKAVTRGWVQLNAVHECYPGHHAHGVKTAAGNMPLTMKTGTLTARCAPLNEGICLRTETLIQDAFGDRLFPLFVAYRRVHTSVRIWADLELFHYKRGTESAVALYMKYMGLDRETATGQVLAQLNTPGYFTVYYYGMKVLERLQKRCGWNDRDFTELIFSSGKVSLDTIEAMVNLPRDQYHFLTKNFYE